MRAREFWRPDIARAIEALALLALAIAIFTAVVWAYRSGWEAGLREGCAKPSKLYRWMAKE